MTAGLFDGLVDDAGLFPPERLPMDDAVARHRADAAAGCPVLTHRFLCPVGALDGLRSRIAPDERWRIGVIADHLAALRDIEHDDRFTVETIELRAADPVAVPPAVDGATAAVHVELPLGDPGWLDVLDVLAGAGLAAKIRCGGLEAGLFPPAGALAAFLVEAHARDVPFKATAGLHHAVRHTDAVTGFTHHGFLNLLLAACRVVEGAGVAEVAEVLLIDDGTRLAGHARAVEPGTAARARAFFRSYGSCSTTAPVEDLIALELLEVRT